MRSLLTLLTALIIIASCKRNDVNSIIQCTSFYDVPYSYNSKQQILDLHIPLSNPQTVIPIVIMVHGGGWNSGDKTNFYEYGVAQMLLNNGYAVVVMNYRLAPEYKYPAQLDDIDSVISYVNTRTKDYFIPGKICLLGRSAGSHLALQYAYTRNWNNKVKAIIDFFGITDLTAKDALATPLDSEAAVLMGVPYYLNPSVWHDASPINHTKRGLPTLIFHGTDDVTVSPTHSIRLRDSLLFNGIPCKCILRNGDNHAFSAVAWNVSMRTAILWLSGFMY